MDRRGFLGAVGAVGLAGCTRAPAEAGQPVRDIDDAPGRISPPVIEAVDLSDLEAEHGGRLGLAAHAVRGQRLLEWRAQERFVYCSTFKLFLAAAVLSRVEAGTEALDREIAVTAEDMISHAPVTETAIGSRLTVERLCQAVVEVSDNPAANILMREIGGLEAMRAWYVSIGDDDTRVDRWELGLNVADGDKDTIRPGQAVENLSTILLPTSTALSQDHRQLLTHWMVASPTGPNRIRAGAPEGWQVAHKTGTAYGAVNDIGVLTSPEGEQIYLAVYFAGQRGEPVARGEAAIATATRRVVEALA